MNGDLEAFLAVGHQACALARKIQSMEWLIFWQRKILDALFESNQRRPEAFKFLEAALLEHSVGSGVQYQSLVLYKCSKLICAGSVVEAKEILETVGSSFWARAVRCAVFAVEGDLQSLKLELRRDCAAVGNEKIAIENCPEGSSGSLSICNSQGASSQSASIQSALSQGASNSSILSPSDALEDQSSQSATLDPFYHLMRLFQGFITAHEQQSTDLKELRESFRDLYFSSISHQTNIFHPNKIQEYYFSLWLNASLLTESAHIPTLLQHSLERFQGKHLDSILAKLALIMRANGQPEEACLWMQIACKRTHSSYLASLFPLLLHWNTSNEFPLILIDSFPALMPIKLLSEGVKFLLQGQLQLHKAKYKFFEALKLANTKRCNNINVKVVALTLLAHAYLGTDLVQAGKVVGAALQLVKGEGGELEGILVRIAKRASRRA